MNDISFTDVTEWYGRNELGKLWMAICAKIQMASCSQ